MSAAGSAVILHTSTCQDGGPSDAADGAALGHLLVAFFMVLLGAWLVLLAPVAGQFPRARGVGLVIATEVCSSLVGPR
ncbi:hypothetical protein BAE44_0024268 [Dichanthelium oligosanthes]|uniref:Uncharacterized protein n=1 Tax=Dichanthelium oligosanthes TaxID=888268 RepID=A0A1E5UPB3_9POAL|nr:hypothetical protein BAE44_0024268 [Dichanthelium oligosanthes]